jgi:hypothetical protein
LAKGLSKQEIRNLYTGQYGLDIETTGLGGTSRSNSMLQFGYATPAGEYFEYNIQQDQFTPSRFHQRKDGIADYYSREGIDITKTSNPRVINEAVTKSKSLRYTSQVVTRERAKQIASSMTQNTNAPVNMIIHNAQFEIKHFDRLFGGEGKGPFQFSEDYMELIYSNADKRKDDIKNLRIGKISKDVVKARDAARQLSVYEQIIKDARKGGAIIDTMEIAKTMTGLAQQHGLIQNAGDIALGTNIEFLAETFLGEREFHRGVFDVRQQNILAPKLVALTEKLKRKDFKASMLNAEELSWANARKSRHNNLKVNAMQKSIQQAIDTIDKGEEFFFHSKTMSTGNINEYIDYLGQKGKYSFLETQGRRVGDYSMSRGDMTKEALNQLDDTYAGLFKKAGGKRPGIGLNKRIKGKHGLMIAGAGLATLGFASILSGKDEDYNTVEGLRHGWFGKSRRDRTDF